ncbi:hypothetical protein RCL_jg16461.t1 [Rhizophagus clarus]|uniref:Uncharacterized protein n=1 Tax=Rhizophagus clarus TaxID=94130 RepID=A0A8H3M5L4_9GLOM|nr:hypothetical protein RCL_jg16461.t1 [Rhizophagus clarus]
MKPIQPHVQNINNPTIHSPFNNTSLLTSYNPQHMSQMFTSAMNVSQPSQVTYPNFNMNPSLQQTQKTVGRMQ